MFVRWRFSAGTTRKAAHGTNRTRQARGDHAHVTYSAYSPTPTQRARLAREIEMETKFDCATPDRCRIQQVGPMTTTLMYFQPVYDGHGNNLNPDRNKTTSDFKCMTCGKTTRAQPQTGGGDGHD